MKSKSVVRFVISSPASLSDRSCYAASVSEAFDRASRNSKIGLAVVVPSGVARWAAFMKSIGLIRQDVTDWKQFFYPESHTLAGS